MTIIPVAENDYLESVVEILNDIRINASVYYRNHVPVACSDGDCIRKIGLIINEDISLRNEFMAAMVHRFDSLF